MTETGLGTFPAQHRTGSAAVANPVSVFFEKLAAPSLVGTAYKGDRQYSVCPHCGDELKAGEIYTAAQGLQYHRPCFRKGKGALRFGNNPVPVKVVTQRGKANCGPAALKALGVKGSESATAKEVGVASSPVKVVEQQKAETCGPAVLRMLGLKGSEAELAREAKTTAKDGTQPDNMIAVAKKHGFKVEAAELSFQKLQAWLEAGQEVICLVQCVSGKLIPDGTESGHYVLATGYKDGKVRVADPATGTFHEFPEKEFVAAWHDSAKGKSYKQYGIVATKLEKVACPVPSALRAILRSSS